MFHRHKFELLQWSHIHVWHFEKHGSPDRVDTEFVGVCQKCGKLRKKRVNGVSFDTDSGSQYLEALGWEHGELQPAD